jgi:hypothetical protein
VFALFFQSENQNESEEEPETVWLFVFTEVLKVTFIIEWDVKKGL